MTEDAQLLPVEAIVEEVLGPPPSGWFPLCHSNVAFPFIVSAFA